MLNLRLCLALTLAIPAGNALAQLLPAGDEFQVNTYTTSAQQRPAVAADAAGNFVIVWDSLGSGGTDASSLSVLGQRFDAVGLPLGDEFQVNSYTTAEQQAPGVAANATGDFVVTWRSLGSFGSDTSGNSIQAQIYGADGLPDGGQFQVNTFTTFEQTGFPQVAFDGFSNFVVAWVGWAPSGSVDVSAQRYEASGAPLGGEFLVNTYTANYQLGVAVAADTAGNFVVAWHSDGSSGTDTSSNSIQAQRYDANGDPLGGEFQVNTYTTNSQQNPAVAMDGEGNFVVAWRSIGSSGSDTDLSSIQARLFDAAGTAIADEFQVNTYTTGDQLRPRVAAAADGDFVVAWQSTVSGGSDTSGLSIQAQHFAADGTPLGGESQVNTFTSSNQQFPAVASDGEGRFVVAWESFGSGGTDSDSFSIQAQRFDVPLPFRDGFERGDTGRWSSSVP